MYSCMPIVLGLEYNFKCIMFSSGDRPKVLCMECLDIRRQCKLSIRQDDS